MSVNGSLNRNHLFYSWSKQLIPNWIFVPCSIIVWTLDLHDILINAFLQKACMLSL
jgi:hypothetical protein